MGQGFFFGPVRVVRTTRLAMLVHSDVIEFRPGESTVWIPKSQFRGDAFALRRKGDTCHDFEIDAYWAASKGIYPHRKENSVDEN